MAVLGLFGTLATAPATADEGSAPTAQVEWGECPEDTVAAAAPTVLQCATVPVPLDYADPDGNRIDIMISKLASQNPDKRRGVLMLNLGGPGSPGLSLPADLVSRGIPASVLDSYDLIGMDTRGVGHSAPVSCRFTADQDYGANIPPYAVDDAAVLEQARIAESVAEQCARNDDDGRLRHLTTANTARDLDRIRAALGEEKASFFGLSYGSALGAAYASMFPDTSDRVVLDSNIGDTALGQEGMRRFALGMEETFPDFAKWVAERHGSYGLGRTPAQVRDTYFELAGRLDEQPVAGLDGGMFRFGTLVSLYGESSYAAMAQLWQSLDTYDVDAVKAQLDADELAPADNNWSVFLAVTCNDSEWSEDVDTYRQAVAEDREQFPLFGAASANISPCAFWPHEPAEPRVEITDEGPSNVLLVQNQRDPATPHVGAEMLREEFGDRSRLLSVDGSGHGVYVFGDNPCASNVTTRYLVDGEMPARDKFCRA
ncbi:alpha/beta fold hydrolase [Prauserella sp. ASG 168]|uniref:Alpha/beta fold hydrolase n=1 Tax=Prauserella cavernicola TaxID=2800127 RepID=A0A934V4N4_9PSEU|nr:alpha/beta fold hydrolase [Prauserella cavernicola]